ncbi:MAG TPA: hypothetical protein VFV38_18650, partial [Ktedonobacteraceae bacterium]|nr:hypothetical protein [Ktedonobacteraceae bacterium]
FLDEMQKFLGIDLNAMTAELRKYGAHFAFATQSFGYLDALDRTLTHTLLANADQLFAFDMSAQDAARMAREIGDGLEAEDILLLDNYACYARLSQYGARLPAFSLRLLPPPAGDPVVVAALQEQSARRYGRPVAAVDAQLRRQDRAGEQKRGPAPAHAAPSPDEDDGLSPDFGSIDRDAQARQWPDAEEEAP